MVTVAWNGKVRFGTSDDLPFLREMLYEAAYWRVEQERSTLDVALARPELAKILEGWGRPGDTAVVAVLDDGTPLGAAWYRFWSAGNHSYGFVDAEIPELGIGVRKDARGCGIGTALLKRLLTYARCKGVGYISLSVEPDNYARNLYEKLGFKKVKAVGGSWTMLKELRGTDIP